MIIYTTLFGFLSGSYIGITLFPFIFINPKYKGNEIIVNHERIHLRQQIELLVIPFYIWYIISYFVELSKYGKHSKAYYNIIFEREAYINEKKKDYLKTRKLYAWLNKNNNYGLP